ncbi:MAG: dihydrolipoyl dehydrogenase [Desulfovibrio sp.]|nr:dihydrolipoyl dehydrogenase [Desulfovibrio sp.]
MRITIIGGGPGGYTAAFEAARRGCEVTLIEQDSLGGTCLNRGCIPTKTLRACADALATATRLTEYGIHGCGAPKIDLDAMRLRKEKVIATLTGGLEKTCAHYKITLLRGTGRVVDAHSVIVRSKNEEKLVSGDAVVIATGSQVMELPGLSFDHKIICSSDDVLRLTHIPRQLVIVGGGVIGCEMACIYRTFGSEVTVIEGQDRLLPLPSVDHDVSTLLQREMRKQKIRILTGRTLKNVHVENGTALSTIALSPFVPAPATDIPEEPVKADMILVTVGRKPAVGGLGLQEAGVAVDKRGWITVDDRLQTSVPGIYAIGDILGPSRVMLAHAAAMEGLCVVDTLCGTTHTMRYDIVPSAVFTSPEIGEVGMSEAQARECCTDVVCGVTQMRELGKAQAMGELPGFFKIVADAQNGRVLGVHIVGAHASDIIAEAGLTMAAGLDVYRLAETVHAHPTLAEGLYETARATLHAMQPNYR